MAYFEQLDSACDDPGRKMFFEHLGVYFSKFPNLKAAHAGTQCGICGSTKAPLWWTNSKEALCIVQHTITRKRKARVLEEETMVPPTNDSGNSCFGNGHFVVAGPSVAEITTNLLPSTKLPQHVITSFLRKGKSFDTIVDLIARPPTPPFVAVAFGANARFSAKITVAVSRIIINGPSPLIVDRDHILRLASICRRSGFSDPRDLINLRARFAGPFDAGISHVRDYGRDQEAYTHLRNSGHITPAEFRLLPSPNMPEAAILAHLVQSSGLYLTDQQTSFHHAHCPL